LFDCEHHLYYQHYHFLVFLSLRNIKIIISIIIAMIIIKVIVIIIIIIIIINFFLSSLFV
jgi:hypothetical protein